MTSKHFKPKQESTFLHSFMKVGVELSMAENPTAAKMSTTHEL